jgi:arsenate reductase
MQKDKKMSIYYVNDNLDSIQKELINHIKNLDIDIPIQQSIKGNNMEKKVLVLCTGNSCRSIMAEALINEYLDGVSAQSSGVRATGVVNKNAIQALNDIGIDTTGYHSKGIEEVIGNNYDLIVTVCDHASETCPTFPGGATVLHLGYEDPTGKEYVEYTKTRDLIKETLLPQVTKALS